MHWVSAFPALILRPKPKPRPHDPPTLQKQKRNGRFLIHLNVGGSCSQLRSSVQPVVCFYCKAQQPQETDSVPSSYHPLVVTSTVWQTICFNSTAFAGNWAIVNGFIGLFCRFLQLHWIAAVGLGNAVSKTVWSVPIDHASKQQWYTIVWSSKGTKRCTRNQMLLSLSLVQVLLEQPFVAEALLGMDLKILRKDTTARYFAFLSFGLLWEHINFVCTEQPRNCQINVCLLGIHTPGCPSAIFFRFLSACLRQISRWEYVYINRNE